MLGIVIPVRNGWEDTRECLESLYAQNFPVEIVLMDTGSTDGTVSCLNEFPCIFRYKFHGANFSQAVNRGCNFLFSFKDIDRVLILNNDTLILDEALKEMSNCSNYYGSVGIVTPRINYYGSELVWSAGGAYNLDWGLTWHENIRVLKPEASNFVDWATGCAMLIHKKCWQEAGGFDEKLPWYDSDVDFCIRAREKSWLVWYTSQALIQHKIGRSSSSWWQVKEKLRGRFLLLKKHVSWWRLPLALLGFMMQALFRFIGSKFR